MTLIREQSSNDGNGDGSLENKQLGSGDYFVVIPFFFLFLLLREGACKWTGRRALKDERFRVVCSHCC